MRKRWIWIFALVFLIVLIMRGIPFLINLYLNDNADRIVSNMITRTSGFGDHQVQFGDIRLDYNYSGTFLQIHDISVKPLEAIDERKVKINLEAERLNISGFSWSSYFFSNTISVDTAVLDNITIYSALPPLDSLLSADSEPAIKPSENKDYDLITVGHFELNHFSVEAKNFINDSTRLSLQDLSVKSDNFRITKEHLQDPNALFDVDHVEGHIGGFELHFDDYRQFVRVKAIDLDTRKGLMRFGAFDLLHKMDKYQYTGQFEYRKGYLTLQDTEVEVRGIDFGAYLTRGIVVVDTLIARNLRLESFSDLRKKEDFDRRPKMVHETINGLEKLIHIRNAIVENGYIHIEERPDNKAPHAGSMFFSELNGHITNISNHKELRVDNDIMEMDASAKLMGKGLVKINVTYALESDIGRFRLKGSMGPMDLTVLNEMIEPEAKVSLKSGKLNRLDFNILGNDDSGEGDLIVRYENFEIELLNRDYEKDRNIFRRLGAFVANRVIIKSTNPQKNGDLREGKVYFERLKNKSMFNYWWQLILSGLKSTVTGDDLEEMKKKEAEHKISDKKKAQAEEESADGHKKRHSSRNKEKKAE
jgi:hypothetical protein